MQLIKLLVSNKAFGVVMWISFTYSFGQSNPVTMEFSDILDSIRIYSPVLQGGRLDVKAIKKTIEQAGKISNPEWEMELEKWGKNEVATSFTQRIPLGGDLKIQKKLAGVERERTLKNVAYDSLQLHTLALNIYVQLIALDQKREYNHQLIDFETQALEEAKNRFKKGALLEAEVLRYEILLSELKLEDQILDTTMSIWSMKLSALWGATNFRQIKPKEKKINLAAEIPATDTLIAYWKRYHPNSKALDLQIKILALEQEQIKANNIPDLNFSAGYKLSPQEKEGAWLLGTGVEIPIWNRNSAQFRALQLKAESLEKQKLALYNRFKSDLNELTSELNREKMEILMLTETVYPLQERLHTKLQEAYQAGKVGQFEVLAALRNKTATKMKVLDKKVIATEKAIKIHEISGYPLEVLKP